MNRSKRAVNLRRGDVYVDPKSDWIYKVESARSYTTHVYMVVKNVFGEHFTKRLPKAQIVSLDSLDFN